MLANFVSPYDATVTTRLRRAGAVLWGRLNCDEFAMGSSTENSAFHPTSNPWDLARVPGGSSGGSSAALAAGEAIATLGSDTGGSIRQPAALCGVVGLKPTYGLVSRFGLVAYASSLDQIGPMTRTVEDAAIVLGAIAGHDERDSTSLRVEVPDYRAEVVSRRGPWRIGIPREYFGEGLDPEVGAAVERAVADLDGDGRRDIAACHEELGCFVYRNRGGGLFGEGVRFDQPKATPYSMITSDLNKDGRPDILVGFVNAPGVMYFNGGDGKSFTAQPFGDGQGAIYGMAAGDLDGDGWPDVVAARSDAPSFVMFNRPVAR